MTALPWHADGTVAVTINNTTVTGTGTSWLTKVNPREGFRGPDNLVYEIASVDSNTQITLQTQYKGSTLSGQAYSICPLTGYERQLAADVATLLTTAGALLNSSPANDDILQRKAGAWAVRTPAQYAVDLMGAGFINNTDSHAVLTFQNNNVGTGARFSLLLSNGATSAYTMLHGVGFTTSGINRQDGLLIVSNGAGGVTVGSTASQPLYFVTNSTERARFTNGGAIITAGTLYFNGTVANEATNAAGYVSFDGANGRLVLAADPSVAFANSAIDMYVDGGIKVQLDASNFQILSGNGLRWYNSGGTRFAHSYYGGGGLSINVDNAGDNLSFQIGGVTKAEVSNSKLNVDVPIEFTPGASVTPTNNGDVVFQLTSNTQFTVKAKGSDGVVRSANLTLA